MKGSRSVFPMPEAILEDRVRVESGTGSMDNTGKVMRVPLGDTPADRHVRAHEMAHAKYSPLAPEGPKGVHMQAIQRAEDMRMNYYCRRAGLDEAMDAPVADADMMHKLVTQPLMAGDVLSAVTAAASCFNTGDWPACVNALRTADCYEKPWADRIMEFIPTLWPDGEPEWPDTLDIAKRLCDFANPPDGGEDGDDGGGGGDPGEPGDEAADESVPVDLSDDPMDAMVDERLKEAAKEAAPADPVEDGLKELKDAKRAYPPGGAAIGWDHVKVLDREIPKPKRVIPSDAALAVLASLF
jgi:hypothetical protein